MEINVNSLYSRRSDGNYADPSKPNYRPEFWRDCVDHWRKTLHWTGNLGDLDFKDLYLTEMPEEFVQDRAARIQATSPEPFFKDAVNDHAALFSQFEIAADAPASLIDNQDNVDLEGSALWQWSLTPLTALFRDGGCLLGADINRTVTLGERRPRLISIPLRDVYWVEYRNFDGIDTLARVAIRRTFNATDSSGNLVLRESYYSYELNEQRHCELTVWTENNMGKLESSEPTPLLDGGGRPLNRIPFTDRLSVIGNLKIDIEHKILSVFAAILELNHEHYNAKSEYNTVKRKTAMPKVNVFWGGGVPTEIPPFHSGSGVAGNYDAESRVEYLELKGESMPLLRQSLMDIEDKIAKRDNKLFHVGGPMSATEADIENQKSKVALPKFKSIIESAYQDLFAIWELLANPNPQPVGGVTIDDSVLETPPQASDMLPYIQAIDRGIPVNAVINAMLRKGLFTPEDFEAGAVAVPEPQQLPTNPDEVIE